MAKKRATRPEREQDEIEIIEDKAYRELNESKQSKFKAFMLQIKDLFAKEQTQFICGIVLLALDLYFTIAYFSYFITGKADQSVLNDITSTDQVANLAGEKGASLMDYLIDGTFGIASAAILVMLALYGLQLLRTTKFNNWHILFRSAFWLFWGSITLAFIQYLTGILTHFRWGGAHGEFICNLLLPPIQVVGLLLILIVTLISFAVITDPQTIPRFRRFGLWLRDLFRKKEKPAVVTIDNDIIELEDEQNESDNSAETVEDDSSQITFNLNDTVEDDSVEDNSQSSDFTVTTGNEEELITEEDDQEEETDLGLEINDSEETELIKKEHNPLAELGPYDPRKDLELFQFPPLSLLKVYDNETKPVIDEQEQNENKDRIVQALRSYGIEIKSISATVGPTVTLFEIVPKEGIRVAKIKNLEDDIMMSLAADGIRIIAPMPGKGTIGIEVPNKKPQIVSMHSVAASRKFQEDKKMRLPVVLGKTITNEVFMFDLAKTPHLLVAGATGQGKSVGLNAIITSLLYKKHPSELKLVLVDPKMVEFTIYKDLIYHYLAAMPGMEDINDIIITDCTKVINTLNSLVIEMEDRYKLLMEANCRNLEDYNEKFTQRLLNPEKGHRFLPYIVIVIDEFGDFIMQAGKEVERPIARITQKARAVGMHMILATQRPSVNIITGVIKANIPTRIAFRTQSIVDSRTVLDTKGAEGLVGKGDLLYSAGNGATRIQCAFVDTPEVIEIVKHIKDQQSYHHPYQLPEYVPEGSDEPAPGSVDLNKLDSMFEDIARFVVANQQGSTSVIQRKFNIGYNRAGRLSDQLEAAGIVGPNNGPKGRQVLVQDEMHLEQILQSLNQKH